MKQRVTRRPVDGILLFDKPLGVSSNDALQRVRRLFRAEKAGHTGNLDPLATGLLPICFGQATKLCGYLLDSDKRYIARVKLGEQTSTGDAEGEVIARSDASAVTRAAVEAVLPAFLGRIQQVPPMYSALKHQGRRLYELARAGEEVERPPREVTIFHLGVDHFEAGSFDLDVTCSKGTYVRTLAEDLAAALGQRAHLAGLRRLEVRPFTGEMVGWERVEAAAADGEAGLDALLLNAAVAVVDWPQVTVEPERAHYLAHGQAVRVAGAPRTGRAAVLDLQGQLLGIAEVNADGMLAPKRWMAG